MKKSANRFLDACNIYIILWMLVHMRNFFWSSSFVSMIFFIPFFLMTLYFFFKTLVNYQLRSVILALSVFFIVLICYGVILSVRNDAIGQDRNSFLMMLFISLGPVFAFFIFSKQGLLTEDRLRNWLLIFVILAVVEYFFNQQRILTTILEKSNAYEYDEVTNNSSYGFVALLPYVFLLRKKPILQYLLLGVVFYFVVYGLKRGAMLIGIVLLFWFVYVSVKSTSRGKKWIILLLTTITLFLGYRYVLQFYNNSDYFQYRVEETLEGSSSKRDYIYSVLWNHYCNNDNLFHLILGEGAFHTENIVGNKAHNDWLELLIDCGILGVVLYLIYWLYFIKEWRRTKFDPLIYAMMGSCFLFTFLRTIFSMSFSDMPFYTCVIMGYCFGQIQSNSPVYLNNKTL